MAGTGDLLGQLIGAALGSGSVRGGSAAPQGGAGGGLPGGLGDILGQVLGGGAGGAGGGAPGSGGLPGGLGDILGQVLGGGGGQRGGAPGLPGGLEDILGQVLGGGGQRPQGQAPQGAAPQGGPSAGSSGGLEDILGQILGGGGPSGGSTQGGGVSGGSGDIGDFASEALGRGGSAPQPGTYPMPEPSVPDDTPRQHAPSPDAGARPSAPASGGNDLLKYGGLAIIGMLAWKAFNKWQANAGDRSAFASGTPDAGFSPAAAPGGPEAFSGVLVAAMAAAAQADGEIDEDELSRIGGGLQKMGAGSPDRDGLISVLTTPVDPNTVVAAATTPEAALQIYAASALAIRPDNEAERAYLEWLASALGIDPGLKAQIDGELNA